MNVLSEYAVLLHGFCLA